MKNKNFPQRSKVTYPLNYDPDLLCGLDRAESRKNMYIDENTTKFYGLDSWTAYELSWLGKEGSIENGVLYFSYPCSSKNFIESKSLKLYLNSLNNKHFEDREKVIELLLNDLSKCVSDTVNIEISEKPRDFLPPMISIDHVNIDADSNQIIDLKNELTCLPEKTDLLILKTGFEAYRQTEDYWGNNPGLLPELAEKLKNKCPRLRAVGMDFISVSSFNNRTLGREAHKAFLLVHDLLLIEDMKLSEMTSQPKEVTIAPLMIDKIDGVPVTVIAQL